MSKKNTNITIKEVSGIYKITNTVTEEFYIGCAYNIRKRWMHHLSNSQDANCKEYNKLLYQNIRQYGKENFNIEVLEEVYDTSTLHQREMYYINTLDAETTELGLNFGHKYEKHNNVKLTKEDVIDIRTRYNNRESKRKVYEDYKHKINPTGFHKIWNGNTWQGIMMEVYTEDNIYFHTHNTGSCYDENPRAKLTKEDVVDIRTRKNAGEKLSDVYKDYCDRVTKGSFKNTWNGYNWKGINGRPVSTISRKESTVPIDTEPEKDDTMKAVNT